MRKLLPFLLFTFLASNAFAQEAAPSFLGVYTWQQVIFQYVDVSEGNYRVEKGNVLGGRLVGGLGFGRFGVELRVDVSGLEGSFDQNDPDTYTTLETFGAVHYILMEKEGFQVGPALVAGSVASERSSGGIKLDVYGGGARLAGHGAEFHVLFARHDYLPLGGWRLSLSGHVPIRGPLYGVGDVVTGVDGYARIGLAVRLK